MNEVSRQLMHLSGILFVLLAQFLDKNIAAAYFFIIALTFLLYSMHFMREERRSRWRIFDRGLRRVVSKVERPGIPFKGAFWFYFSCGLTFLLFPHIIATAACIILAVSDSISTLVGKQFGRKRLAEGKTLEGAAAFFLSAAVIAAFFSPHYMLTAAAATVGELLPGVGVFRKLNQRALLDDNLTIPLFAAIALILLG